MSKPRVSGYAIAQRRTTEALRELVASAGKEEYRLQCDVVALLRRLALPGVVFWHCENERKRSHKQAASFKAMGGLAGVSDLIISMPGGRIAFLELKSKRGRMTEDQEAFQAGQERNGHICGVARNIEEATIFLMEIAAIRATKVAA